MCTFQILISLPNFRLFCERFKAELIFALRQRTPGKTIMEQLLDRLSKNREEEEEEENEQH